MKKTLTANISGSVFHIEEDAYERLNRYLDTIRAQFQGTVGRDEIMADIESRIAELFTERLGTSQVVTLGDVDHVIGVMGQPEDYVDGDAFDDAADEPRAGSRTGRRPRRLFRDPDDRWVGGVLSGVAAYFGTDPLILRLLYIILLFAGFGIILYLILWAVVPVARTSRERLQMRGEPITVDNIKRMFDEGSSRFEAGAGTVAQEAREMGRRYAPRARRSADNALGFLGEAIRLFLLAVGKIMGFVLLLAGGVIAILLLILFLGKFGFLWGGFDVLSGSHFNELAGLLFVSPAQFTWAWIGMLMLVLIPVIGLLYGGVSLLFGVKGPKWFGYVLAPLWIAAIVLLSVIATQLANDFRSKGEQRDEVALAQPINGILHIAAMRDPHFGEQKRYRDGDPDLVRIEDNTVILGWTRVNVTPSPDHEFHLFVERRARGDGTKDAMQRASTIAYEHQQVDSLLRISPLFSFNKPAKYRGQEIRYELQVPQAGMVYFDESSARIIYDIENVTNTRDRDMIGKMWRMDRDGLRSADSPAPGPIEIEEGEEAEADGPIAASVWQGVKKKSEKKQCA